MYSYMFAHPSFYAHILNGLLIAIAIIFVIMGVNEIRNWNLYKVLVLILLFATVIGIHGISHFYLEKEYGYNPL